MIKKLLPYFFVLTFSFSAFAQQKAIDSLLKILPQLKNDSNKVNVLNRLSNYYIAETKFDDGLNYANQALNLAVKVRFIRGTGLAYHYLGNVKYYQNDYQGSIPFYEKCLAAYEIWSLTNPKDTIPITFVAAANNDIGFVYDYLSNYPKALQYYLKCLKASESVAYQNGLISAYTNIASIYDYQHEYNKALEFNFKALELNKKMNRQYGVGICYNNIANVYYNLGRYSIALKYHKLGLETKRKIVGDDLSLAGSLNNLGGTFIELSEMPLDSLVAFYPQFSKLSYQEIKKNLLDSAEVYLFECLPICKRLENNYALMQVYRSLGNAFYKKQEYVLALAQYKNAVEIGNQLKTQKELYESFQTMADISFRMGKYNDAFVFQKMYSDLKDTVLNENKEKDLGKQEARFEYDKELLAKEKEQEKKDAIAEEEKNQQKIIIVGVSLLALILMFFAIYIFRSYRHKQQANIEITRQKVIIEEKNKEVHDSITYAKRIQNAILPPNKVIKQHLSESFVLFKPKDIVSGDFYWLENSADKVLFAAVDCTGHGVPGAMVSVVGNSGLNRAVKEFGLSQPAAILDKLTKLVEETFVRKDSYGARSENEVKDGMDISLCCLDVSKRMLEWSGANNPLWICRNGKMEITTANKQPIGAFEHRKPFTNHSFQLEKGDTIYIFTDGYADQFGGEKGKKFKYKQLEELLIKSQQYFLEEQKTILDKAFENWKKDLEQIDDVCIIGVRV